MSTPHLSSSLTASPTLRRALLPAVALLAGSSLAVSAAHGQTGRTLVLTSGPPTARDVKRGDLKQVDLRPRGLSPGDYFLAAGTLRENGRVTARAHAICTVIDHSYKGQDCHFLLVFRDGTVTASGGGLNRLLPGQRPSPPHSPDEYAVTGGTGAYRGATGTMFMQAHRDDSSTITLSL
jgi:hypothetical protein